MEQIEVKASTLNEILIVMLLIGIVSLIAFEGLSSYRQMYTYVMFHNKQTVDICDNYFRIQNLFCNADSICEDDGYYKVYRENDCLGSFCVSDSVMTFKPNNSLFIDTLFKNISEYEIKVCDNGPKGHVDSLFIVNDDVLLKFGLCIQPECLALSDVLLIEQNDSYENR